MLNSFLVIDDEEADQVIAEYVIRQYNPDATIHKCYDGIEGLACLDNLEAKPDIILLDINMPRMNGHEFLTAYSQRADRAPTVVMLTSSSHDRDREQAMKFDSVIEYLDKPLEVDHCQSLAAKVGV